MPVVWECAPCSTLPVGPAGIAEEVAQELGVTSEPFVELLTLYAVALDTAIATDSTSLLVDHVAWQRSRLRVVAPTMTPRDVAEAAQRRLAASLAPADAAMVEATAEEALRIAEQTPAASEGDHLSPRARAFLDRLLAGDRRGALAEITEAVVAGTDVQEILLDVFEPVLIEIGRLWEQGRVSVAQEHFCTAVTQLAMSLLYPHLFEGRDTGYVVVAVGAGNEAHEVGLRIVTDLLEQAGWRTTYLGSGVPAEDVVEELVARKADLLALSGTMPGHLRHVRRIIAAVRADPRSAGVRIVVGGRLFQLEPSLVEAVGADGWASDGTTVVEVCTALVEGIHAHQ